MKLEKDEADKAAEGKRALALHEIRNLLSPVVGYFETKMLLTLDTVSDNHQLLEDVSKLLQEEFPLARANTIRVAQMLRDENLWL